MDLKGLKYLQGVNSTLTYAYWTNERSCCLELVSEQQTRRFCKKLRELLYPVVAYKVSVELEGF